MSIIKNDISQYVYKLRAEILLNIYPETDIGGCKHIDSNTNVGYLASILFKETPSFKEVSQCNTGCPPRHKKLQVIQIEELNIAERKDFNELVKQSVILKGARICCTKECTGFEKTTLTETGKKLTFYKLLLNINEINIYRRISFHHITIKITFTFHFRQYSIQHYYCTSVIVNNSLYVLKSTHIKYIFYTYKKYFFIRMKNYFLY